MHRPRITTGLLCFLGLLLVLGVPGTWGQYYRPENPTMDFVPQNMGIDDKLYCEFQEPECRGCHGASTASLHHNTSHAKSKRCLLNDQGCHEVIPGPDVEPVRDCKMCHIDDDPPGTHPYPSFHLVWGDKGSPHHSTDEADSYQCNHCHSWVVEHGTGQISSDYPPGITFTPAACENCHWWDAPVPGTNPLNPFGPIHAPGGIVTWGPAGDGIYPTYGLPSPPNRGFDPVALPSSGTHQSPSQGLFAGKCWLCHWSQEDTQWDTNPYDLYAIRYCENCHSWGSLHSNLEHVYGNDIYVVNGVPGQTVDDSEKCYACHGDHFPGFPPPSKPNPGIESVEPGLEGSQGQTLTVKGSDFGDREDGDDILMGGMSMPVISWADNQIEAQVPGISLPPGDNYGIEVIKAAIPDIGYAGGKAARTGKFALHPHPLIDYLEPYSDRNADMDHDCGEKGYAGWADKMTIWGSGFGAARESVVTSGYGYVSHVELHTLADIYRVRPDKYIRWQDNKVRVKLEDFYDVNAGTQVTPEEFYVGDWEVEIIRAYVTDTNGDGDLMNADGSMDWETGTDTLEYQETSESMDPMCPIELFVTDGPIIRFILPEKGQPLTKIKIMGENFGTMLGESVIQCIKESKVHLLNAVGYYAGPPVNPLLHPSHKPLDKNNRANKIKMWANTKVKFKIPAYGNLPRKIAIRVDVYGQMPSNVVAFKMKP